MTDQAPTTRPTTDPDAVSACCHPACIACRPPREGGLGLSFDVAEDGSVTTHFACDAHYQGYPDRLHGGIVATLLDSAMTHCLFARRIRGMTARLNIAYRHPVDVGAAATVRAWLVEFRAPLYILKAELIQHDRVRVTADAKFHGAPLDT